MVYNFQGRWIPDLHDLIQLMLRVWEPYNLHALYSTCFLGWVCTLTDRAQQPLTTAGEELDYLDHYQSDLSEELDYLDHYLSDLSEELDDLDHDLSDLCEELDYLDHDLSDLSEELDYLGHDLSEVWNLGFVGIIGGDMTYRGHVM